MTIHERYFDIALWLCAGASFGLGIVLLANAIWEVL